MCNKKIRIKGKQGWKKKNRTRNELSMISMMMLKYLLLVGHKFRSKHSVQPVLEKKTQSTIQFTIPNGK